MTRSKVNQAIRDAEMKEIRRQREWQRQPTPDGIAPPVLNDLERFMAKVEIDEETECWNWRGAVIPSGYSQFGGMLRGKRRTLYAHRVAYSWFTGPIPSGLTIDHLCRNRRCVNPLHLEAVTQRENTLRGEGFAAIHAAKTHCDYGHSFDAANTYLSPLGRVCRACAARRARDLRARRKAEA